MAVWNAAIRRHDLPASAAAWNHISDPGFLFPWIGVWEWQPGNVTYWLQPRTPGRNAVWFKLNGYEASHQILLAQWLPLRPGHQFLLSFSVRGRSVVHPYGVICQIYVPDGQWVAGTSVPLASHWQTITLHFQWLSGQPPLARLFVKYSRPLGHKLLRGSIGLAGWNLSVRGPALAPPRVALFHGQ